MDIFPLARRNTSTPENTSYELERLIDTYGNDVLRIAYMYLKSKDKAEDAFQDVFMKVCKNWGKFKQNCSEKTWLITITINVCKDILKNSWNKKVNYMDSYDDTFEQPDTTYKTVEDETIENIQYEELLHEILKLPPKYKEIILLYYYEGMDSPEIGKMLNIPEGTVRSRLFRARELLKNSIDKEALT